MTLAELTTPFQKREIIDYAADQITVRCRRYEMQHVSGPLYKSRERTNRKGQTEFDLFLVYDGVEKGMMHGRRMTHPEWYTVEQYQDSLHKIGYDTLENFLASMEERIHSDRFVGNAAIAFIRQFDVPLADRYAQHRLAYYARKEEEDRKRILAAKAEKEAERVQREAARKAEREKLHGWADDMSALRFGRVMSILSKKVRVERITMYKYEFVLWALQNGWVPKMQEATTVLRGKWDVREGKPHTEYWFQRKNLFYRATKTEFDYAEFLLRKGIDQSTCEQ